MRDRLSERAARQHVAVAEDIDRVDEQDVHVARKLPVLVAVIQDRDLRAEVLDRVLPRKRSLGADEHGHFGQMLGEHEGFVARLGRVHVELLPVGDNADVAAPLRTIAAVQDDDTIAHVADRRRQVLCSRRFSRAADRDVTEADDVAGEMLALEKPRLIAPEFQVHEMSVDDGERVEHPHDAAQNQPFGMTAAHEVGDVGAEVLDTLCRAHLARILVLLEVL